MSKALHKHTMCLFDLPPELLEAILHLIHVTRPRERKAWAIKASTTSKAFYNWVFPIVWDKLDINESTATMLVEKYDQKKYVRKDFWDHTSAQFRKKLASHLQVLMIDTDALGDGNSGHLRDMLSGSAKLIAMALGDQSRTQNSAKRRKVADDATNSYILPWQFSPGSGMPKGSRGSPVIFASLRRLVLMDSKFDVTYKHYANLLIDQATGKTVCPALTSICLIIYSRGYPIDLDEDFVDAMVTFRANHKKLCHVELYFQHYHDDYEDSIEAALGEPCTERIHRHFPVLNELVDRAKVSVTLHHETLCEDMNLFEILGSLKESCKFFEQMGVNFLRMTDRYGGAHSLWQYKAGKLAACAHSKSARANMDVNRADALLEPKDRDGYREQDEQDTDETELSDHESEDLDDFDDMSEAYDSLDDYESQEDSDDSHASGSLDEIAKHDDAKLSNDNSSGSQPGAVLSQTGQP